MSQPSGQSGGVGGRVGAGPILCVLWHAPGTRVPGALREALGSRGLRCRECESAYRAFALLCRSERQRRRIVGSADEPGERRRRIEAASVPEGSGRPVLLLVHPGQLSGVEDVLHAVKVYTPSVACWVFDGRGEPALRALSEADRRAWAVGSEPGGVSAGGGGEREKDDPGRDRVRPVVRTEAGRGAGGRRVSPGAGPRAGGFAGGGSGLRLAGEGAWPAEGPGEGAGESTSEEMDSQGSSADNSTRSASPARAMLTDEELAMLLAEDEPEGPRRGER